MSDRCSKNGARCATRENRAREGSIFRQQKAYSEAAREVRPLFLEMPVAVCSTSW